jgi:hypothetical protein
MTPSSPDSYGNLLSKRGVLGVLPSLGEAIQKLQMSEIQRGLGIRLERRLYWNVHPQQNMPVILCFMNPEITL